MLFSRWQFYETDFKILNAELTYTGKIIKTTPFYTIEEARASFGGKKALLYMRRYKDGSAVVHEVLEDNVPVRNHYPEIFNSMTIAYTEDPALQDYYIERRIKQLWILIGELISCMGAMCCIVISFFQISFASIAGICFFLSAICLLRQKAAQIRQVTHQKYLADSNCRPL